MGVISNMSIGQFHSIVTLAWGLICLLMGINLLAFNIPEKEIVRTYKTSVRILAIDYLVLSILTFCMVFFGLRNSPDDIFPIPILLINLSQGLILTYSLVTLYAPNDYAWKKVIYFNIIPLSVLIVIYTICALMFGDPVCDSFTYFFSHLSHPAILMRFILLLFIVYQITFFAIQVQKLAVRYTECLNQYYSDTIQLKPQWAKKNFYFATSIGILSIVTCLFKNIIYDTIFTIVFCFFYYLFALRYMRYESIFLKLEPKFIEDLFLASKSENTPMEDKQIGFNWEIARNQIVEQKLFLQSGITVNDMAELFQTNRTSFSAALNKVEGQNFNTFINRLRIEYAKQLLIEKPEQSISKISERCGFTEQSNFTRQFKQHCNETPAVWKKKATFYQFDKEIYTN
jgi:AraC-like DNA-binding protein